jgi:phosphoserine phosphatase RsbU/P
MVAALRRPPAQRRTGIVLRLVKRARPSIRLIVPLALVGPLVVFAAVLISLSVLTSMRIAEGLGEQLMRGASSRVQRELSSYLADAMRMSELYARRIESGRLSLDDPQSWEPALLEDLVTSPMVASICFGWERGDAVWLLRSRNGMELGFAWGDRGQEAIEWVLDKAGERGESPLRTYTYDPRLRPWYAAARDAGGPTWTPVYHWFGEMGSDQETGTGYARPVYGERGELLGVLVIDITLGAVSQYLKQLPLAENGTVFVVDAHQKLVAASHGSVSTPGGQRMMLGESPSAAARAVAGYWREDAAGLGVDDFAIELPTGPARVAATSLGAYPGLDWTIVVVLPEAAFLAHAGILQQRSVIIASVATIGAVLLGLLVARMLTRPIVKLREHTRRIGDGEFDAELSLPATSEFEALAADLNQMAQHLDERTRLKHAIALATEVQQSLLPGAPPSVGGLDVEGHSRYCDSTGGDYFDFIGGCQRCPQRMMFAVGDVMGHGIAAALLMATARGVVRSRMSECEPLGELLMRVNDVLAIGARCGRFMTMTLAEVDRPNRRLCWANAGHGEPIIYVPDEDRFLELSGGGMPLGIIEGVAYETFEVRDLPDGAIIFLATDGVWEARNADGEEFGMRRIHELLRRHASLDASALAALLRRELDAFLDGQPRSDDETFLIVRVVPEPAGAHDARTANGEERGAAAAARSSAQQFSR